MAFASHTWTAQSGCLSQDVLTWLRANFDDQSFEPVELGDADSFGKYCVTGRTDDNCDGATLNGRFSKNVLPTPRVRAWM